MDVMLISAGAAMLMRRKETAGSTELETPLSRFTT